MNADDPLIPEERDEYETDLIAFSNRELDLLGDVRGCDVLYAGGISPLWIEGLAERIGENGSLIVLDKDEDGLARAEAAFAPDDLPLRPRFVVGNVFDLPFERGTFDLVYSSGLFHELDVSEKSAMEALSAMASVLRSGGRFATSDFVDDAGAVQIEAEVIEAEMERRVFGAKRHGIGSSERLVELHERSLSDVRHRASPPFPIRHLDKLLPSEDEPPEFSLLSDEDARRLRARWRAILDRVRREGYTRPATVYIEGGTKSPRI
ncbi:MAG: class I SAM-dependent methyltransferase [Rubrobacter sp.]|nr:class I SAM-dependent methyltransferase [Rubrobacter sp.]